MKIWPGQSEDFKPPLMSPKEKGNLWLGLSGVSFVLAAASYFSPPSAPVNGRWAWLHNIFSNLFGPSGEIVLFLVLGISGVLAALVQYSAHSRESGGR